MAQNLIEHCMSICADIPDELIYNILLNCATLSEPRCNNCTLLPFKYTNDCTAKIARLSLTYITRLQNSGALNR